VTNKYPLNTHVLPLGQILYTLGIDSRGGKVIYRGYEIKTGWPLGQPVKVLDSSGHIVKEFPFETTDETVMNYVDAVRQDKKGE